MTVQLKRREKHNEISYVMNMKKKKQLKLNWNDNS